MHVPKSPLRTLWVAAGHVQLEDNALISSLRAGDAHLAVRPRLSVTSMPLLHPLCLPTWFQPIPDETHYTWTWQLVHQLLRACRIWPQSRGNPMRWQWAGQISHDCQIRVRSGSVCQSPKKSSFLWSSSQVSVTWQKWQLWVVLLCLYWALLKDLWKPCRMSVSVAQDAWCVMVAHLSRKHSLFVRGNLETCACA